MERAHRDGRVVARSGGALDTVSVCLSKGLGAPVGSVLVSTADRIAEARVWRKRYGSGMRQVGILAAAGQYAVRHNVGRLAEDHRRAARLAAELSGDASAAPTNMVVLDVPDAAAVAEKARDADVLISALGRRTLRLVTHLDLDDAAVERAIEVLAPLVNGG